MGLIAVGVLIPFVLAIGAIGALFTLVRQSAPSPSEAAHAARRHAAAVHAAALVCLSGALIAGFVIITGLPTTLRQGLYLGLVPAAAGLAFAAAHAVGELTWPRPTGQLRRAVLARRTAADVAPTRLRRATWAWAAAATCTLVLCGLAASDDGRSITSTFAQGTSGAGPFPGWFYGVPLLAAVALVTLAAEGVLRLIARRPAVMDAAPEWDLALRRLSAHRLLRGAQLVLGLTATGVLVVGGTAVTRVAAMTYAIDGVTTTDTQVGYTIVGAAMVAVGLAVALAALLLALIPGTPATAPDLTPAREIPAE